MPAEQPSFALPTVLPLRILALMRTELASPASHAGLGEFVSPNSC
jgi:hypothetical protein